MRSHGFKCRGLRRTVVLALSLLTLLSACDRPPPLARGLPLSFGPTQYFDARLKKRFPIGSDASKLMSELRIEGFEINGGREPYQFSARYEVHDLACRESWAVYWAAEQGKIATIGGDSRQTCL